MDFQATGQTDVRAGTSGRHDASTSRGDPFGSFAFQFIGAVRSGTSRYGCCVACYEGSRSPDEDFSCSWTRRHRASDDRLGFRQNHQCHRSHQQQTPAEQSAHPCSRVRHFRRWDSDSDAACWCDWRGRHSGPCTRHRRSRVGGSIRSADRIGPGVAVRRQRSPLDTPSSRWMDRCCSTAHQGCVAKPR